VYSGGNKPKNASSLASKTGLSEVATLQLATPMAHKQYFENVRDNGRVAFKKYPHINAVKHNILRLAVTPKWALDRPGEPVFLLVRKYPVTHAVGEGPATLTKTNDLKPFACHTFLN
jgi:hypothetical protein